MQRAASPDSLRAVLAGERRYLLRFALARERDAVFAEDAVQDTLLVGLRSLGGFEQRASLRTWLTSILIRKLADAHRHARVRRVTAGDVATGSADGDGEDPAGFQPQGAVDPRDPERVLAARQAAQVLQRGLAGLAPLAQRLFELRELDGVPAAEAARQLGLTPERGALLLHRTRERLRLQLHRAHVA